jgi:hypothetical protein
VLLSTPVWRNHPLVIATLGHVRYLKRLGTSPADKPLCHSAQEVADFRGPDAAHPLASAGSRCTGGSLPDRRSVGVMSSLLFAGFQTSRTGNTSCSRGNQSASAEGGRITRWPNRWSHSPGASPRIQHCHGALRTGHRCRCRSQWPELLQNLVAMLLGQSGTELLRGTEAQVKTRRFVPNSRLPRAGDLNWMAERAATMEGLIRPTARRSRAPGIRTHTHPRKPHPPNRQVPGRRVRQAAGHRTY